MPVAAIKPSAASGENLELESMLGLASTPLMSFWKRYSSSFVSLALAMPPIWSPVRSCRFSFMWLRASSQETGSSLP